MEQLRHRKCLLVHRNHTGCRGRMGMPGAALLPPTATRAAFLGSVLHSPTLPLARPFLRSAVSGHFSSCLQGGFFDTRPLHSLSAWPQWACGFIDRAEPNHSAGACSHCFPEGSHNSGHLLSMRFRGQGRGKRKEEFSGTSSECRQGAPPFSLSFKKKKQKQLELERE